MSGVDLLALAYRRDIAKKLMREYAAKWEGLPMPRLQLRWAPKPVPNSDPKRRKDIAQSKRISRLMGYEYQPDYAWDCFYELILPADKYDVRNEHYEVGFIIVPISWTRRGTQHAPCSNFPLDDTYRDGAHAFWDSKALGWLPIFVVAPDGTATMKDTYHEQPKEWPEMASALRARHQSAAGEGENDA